MKKKGLPSHLAVLLNTPKKRSVAEKIMANARKSERFVYGTRTKKWHKIHKGDRDWDYGLTFSEMKRIGEKRARKKYLLPRMI